MNRSSRSSIRIGALALVSLLLAGAAQADPVALDYHSKEKGCASPDRFADEVSAKLGFVPWDAQAATAIRVRITSDSGDLVGTIEQPDGSSKVLRAATCAKLGEALVSTIAVVLDRPATVTAPSSPRTDERRLRRLERETPDELVTVQLRAKDGRELEISRVIASSMIYGYRGSAGVISVEKVCKLPCTARLTPGTHTLVVRDLATQAAAREDAEIQVSSTLDIDYVSRDLTRRSSMRRTKWGMWIGLVAGVAGTALLVESQTDRNLYHMFDVTGGLVGALVGGVIGHVAGPGYPADETHFTVRPGLHDATALR